MASRTLHKLHEGPLHKRYTIVQCSRSPAERVWAAASTATSTVAACGGSTAPSSTSGATRAWTTGALCTSSRCLPASDIATLSASGVSPIFPVFSQRVIRERCGTGLRYKSCSGVGTIDVTLPALALIASQPPLFPLAPALHSLITAAVRHSVMRTRKAFLDFGLLEWPSKNRNRKDFESLGGGGGQGLGSWLA